MALTPISGLPSAASIDGTEYVPVVQSGQTRKALTGAFATSLQGTQGAIAYSWGDHSAEGYALAADLSTVATSGAYADLGGKPTLGTAAPLDVPAAGNAAAGEVVKGDDTRLTDDRDPTAHTHTKSQITDFDGADYATAAQGTKADAAMPAAGGTFTGTATMKGVRETATSGTADFALSVANGTRHTLTLTAETDLTDSLSDGDSISVRVIDGDSEVLNYVAGTIWVGGEAPTLTGDDRLTFEKWGSDLIGYAGLGLGTA